MKMPMAKKRKLPSSENPMAGDLAPPPERQFYSVVFLSGLLQEKTPDFIHGLMRAANVKVALSLNGCEWLAGTDVQKMSAVLERQREAAETAEAAPNN
jgi:hypothetical protein